MWYSTLSSCSNPVECAPHLRRLGCIRPSTSSSWSDSSSPACHRQSLVEGGLCWSSQADILLVHVRVGMPKTLLALKEECGGRHLCLSSTQADQHLAKLLVAATASSSPPPPSASSYCWLPARLSLPLCFSARVCASSSSFTTNCLSSSSSTAGSATRPSSSDDHRGSLFSINVPVMCPDQ